MGTLPVVPIDAPGRRVANAPRPDWHSRPKPCDTDPEVWFPIRRKHVDAARAVCAECPFRFLCLEDALEIEPEFGVWAGHTAYEIECMVDKATGREPRRTRCEHPLEEMSASLANGQIICRTCSREGQRARYVSRAAA